MSRPKMRRRISEYPVFWSFQPTGSQARETILLALDEFEVIRLIDRKGLSQEQCALQMKVSRATVASIYDSARAKLAGFLIDGKRLRITGGSYAIDSIPESARIPVKKEDAMRVAVTYENGNVGQHFGRTEQFKVYEIEDGVVKSSQVVDTNGAGHSELAGFLRAAEVDAVICGGIGMGARNAINELGIAIFAGVEGDVEMAVRAYLEDRLDFNPNMACDHHGHEDGSGCHDSNGDGGCAGGCCR